MSHFDGHLHSTASDGVLDAAAVVELAHRGGVAALALTDHDTFAGHAAAAARAQALGLDFVPGVEMSCDLGGRELHILAYFVDSGAAELDGALAAARTERHAHLERALARLAELGFPVEREVVLKFAGDAAPGRPHLARALIAAGHVATMDEAFKRLLATGRPGHVPRRLPAVERMIALCQAAGGVTSVAHPGIYDLDAATLDTLQRFGLDGIEIYHPEHSTEQRLYYLRHAERLRLLPTGGSDFHAPGKLSPGGEGLDAAGLDRLRARAASRRGRLAAS